MDRRNEIPIGIGKISYTYNDILFCAAVGSCVALTIRNNRSGYTGMAHVFLPDAATGHHSEDSPGKYADWAVTNLINNLLIKTDSSVNDLSAYVSGGAQMFPIRQAQCCMDIGKINAERVRQLLIDHHIVIKFWDVGGKAARTVAFDAAKGEISVTKKDDRTVKKS